MKRYRSPATSCDRVIDHAADSSDVRAGLVWQRAEMDPVALLHSIREVQSTLAAVVSQELRPTPRGESLEQFLV